MSAGAPGDRASQVALSGIRSGPLDPAEVLDAVARPGAGGTALFLGTVRDTPGPVPAADPGSGADSLPGEVPGADGPAAPVAGLDYSAHPDAGQVLAAVAAEVAAAGPPGVVLAVLHRTGSLDLGGLAIAAAASAPHRGAAFDACERLVDEVKARVPIWKRERFADGATAWVGLPRTAPGEGA